MSSHQKRIVFAFFVLSGATGLIYQIVWVRMALSYFGVITPFASVVVSVFMLGLALGTWLGGRYTGRIASRLGVSPLAIYGAAEAIIGLSAFVLPLLFAVGRFLLLPIGEMGSGLYLILSSLVITLSMLPWCLCMGATFPAMMTFIEGLEEEPSGSFSLLYLANVIGAMAGAIATSVALIELVGFRGTLYFAALLNGSIAAGALWLARSQPAASAVPTPFMQRPAAIERGEREIGVTESYVILFLTGFCSMALEIVWMRAFTPVLGTLVYAFAGLLTVYLFATWLGSFLYRRDRARGRCLRVSTLLAWLAPCVMLPVVVAIPSNLLAIAGALSSVVSPIVEVRSALVMIPVTLLSILPFCGLLGYLTPMLVDDYSEDHPERAGRAYAINITGSVVGPLAAAYALLPLFGARLAMVVLALPFAILFGLHLGRRSGEGARSGPMPMVGRAVALLVTLGALVQTTFFGRSFEEGSHIQRAVVLRDHTATVISYGRGFGRHLLVNGYGMTVLSPLTKIMAHLPLVTLDHPPKKALVIAFGMGTTFRSLLSWDLEATAVELVPSVVDAFPYYHEDAADVLANPRGRVLIDDGRRFLARSREQFDLITIDPPPPVETAGSSLLYADEFYEIVKQRLAPGGILLHWFPDAANVEPAIREAVMRGLARAFPHLKLFYSIQGRGLHILCSMEPIDVPDAYTFVERLPEAARRDLMEYQKPGASIEAFVQRHILDKAVPLDAVLGAPEGPTITDDRPFNEYFLMRRGISPDQS